MPSYFRKAIKDKTWKSFGEEGLFSNIVNTQTTDALIGLGVWKSLEWSLSQFTKWKPNLKT